ncbi:restriction endonuclease subunit S [Streptomyces bikiniensis]|uniref:restriction endonuclease subunit S n=1 Tax=Streptomyces bikiniensis TaxID=1896 RepID=UPI000D12E3E5|nr:restriction endonuclease subunit S [Streptomyces bikiniensis]
MSTDAEIRWVPVREVGEVRMGKQLSPSSREAAGQFPYLRVANVLQGRIDYSDVNSMGFSSGERKIYGLKPGDILLNEGQSLELVGRSAIYQGSSGAYCFQNTLVRFRPGSEVLPAYAQIIFERWLATGVFAAIAKQTTSIAHLGGERFGALLFPLRSMAEQRRIVEVIEAVSAQERAIDASIAKQETNRHAVLSSVISQSWGEGEERSVQLGSFIERVEAGWSPSCDASPPGVNEWGVIRVSAVSGGRFLPHESKRLPAGLTPRPDLEIRPGDLLMARANGVRSLVGTVCLVEATHGKLMLSDKTLRLVPDEVLACAEFLEIALKMPPVRGQIDTFLSGSTGQANISQAAVRQLAVPNVPLWRQWKIVEIAHALDKSIHVGFSELEKLRLLKVSLLDDLLSV